MSYVFYSIQWQDQLQFTRDSGINAESIAGRIYGPWDQPQVRFQAMTEETPRQWSIGPQSDGARLSVAPGFLTYLRNIDGVYFALGALCFVLTVIFAGVRWRWLLKAVDLNISLLTAQRYTWIGLFCNNFIPGGTGGDFIKAFYIMRDFPASRLRAVFSVLVDRLLGLVSLALLGAFVVLFFLERFFLLAMAIWGVIAIALVIGTLLFSRRVRKHLGLNRLVDFFPASVQTILLQIDQAVMMYRANRSGVLTWLLLGIGNHGVSVTCVVFFGQALGVGLPNIEYFILVPVINIVSAIPIAPNGWGIGEALYGKLFATYGSEYVVGISNPEVTMQTRGITLSILFRVNSTIWSLLGGLAMLLDKNRPRQKDFNQALDKPI